MIVGRYVRQLLSEGKRVVLPGFGNLEVKEGKSSVPVSGARIEPPGISVVFNTGYSKDDGQLSTAYAKGEGLDEEEARQRVLELVDAIRFALDKGESYRLPEAGTFQRDPDGKVYFTPDPGWVVAPGQYGLEPMDILELEDLPEEEVPEPEPVPEVVEKSPGPVAEGAPVEKEPNRKEENLKPWEREDSKRSFRRTRRWRAIWIVTGLLIILLVVLIIVPVDILRNPEGPSGPLIEREEPEPPAMQGEPQEEAPPAMSDDREEEQPAEGSNAEDELPAESSDPEEVQPVETGPEQEQPAANYYIIAGSFRNLANASEMQDRLKAMGYPAEVMITENRMYRISVASYALKSEAEDGLRNLKEQPGLESVWLLSN